MQKRSFGGEIRFVKIGLDPILPICGGEWFRQEDRPITYLHFHECLEIGYCHSGSGIFMIGEKILPFKKGDVSLINHTEVHLARSAPGTSSEWSWIYLDPVCMASAQMRDLKKLDPTPLAGPDFNNMLSASRHPMINRIVLDMIEELGANRKGRADILRALAWQLMALALRLLPEKRRLTPRIPEYDRIVPALQFMAHRYADPVQIKSLAKLCHVSEAHFRKIFLKAIGQSPRAYWHAMRLRMAASLLSGTSLSVLEISQEVGFETLSSFNRLFLKTFGISPRRWRNSL